MKTVTLYIVPTFLQLDTWIPFLILTCKSQENRVFFERHHLTIPPQNPYITCCTSTIKGVHIFAGAHNFCIHSPNHQIFQFFNIFQFLFFSFSPATLFLGLMHYLRYCVASFNYGDTGTRDVGPTC